MHKVAPLCCQSWPSAWYVPHLRERIEVVRWFVHQKQRRALSRQSGEQDALSFTPRHRIEAFGSEVPSASTLQ